MAQFPFLLPLLVSLLVPFYLLGIPPFVWCDPVHLGPRFFFLLNICIAFKINITVQHVPPLARVRGGRGLYLYLCCYGFEGCQGLEKMTIPSPPPLLDTHASLWLLNAGKFHRYVGMVITSLYDSTPRLDL